MFAHWVQEGGCPQEQTGDRMGRGTLGRKGTRDTVGGGGCHLVVVGGSGCDRGLDSRVHRALPVEERVLLGCQRVRRI